jgi:arginine decarboxylase
MGLLDMGGGLAVDYDGSQANFPSSCNYTLEEYASDLVEIVQQACDEAGLPHPDLITESGRAVVAYYSVLVFDILDVNRFEEPVEPEEPVADAHEHLHSLWALRGNLDGARLQESFNDALFYRDQVRSLFSHGIVDLRARAHAERIYWHVVTLIAHRVRDLPHVPEDLQNLDENLIDIYYGNFSVFQSLPDSWAIKQLFPIMPLHRLDEEPTRQGVLSDITCDCDGKIDRFIDLEDVKNHLPLHPRAPGEDYFLGTFLVGAYQETLGDLHNLLGDPNVVSVGIAQGELTFSHEVEGDTVADVLSYVEYDPKDLETRFRAFAETAVKAGKISAEERRSLLHAYRDSMRGYTYYE